MYIITDRSPFRFLLTALLPCLALLCSSSTLHASPDDEGGNGKAGYDGGFFLESQDANFRLNLSGRVQTRYEALLAEENGDYQLTRSRFLIRRARFKLDGHALTERLTFEFQADFKGNGTELLDYWMNYAFAPGILEARVGQWRPPFLRHEITSSSNLLLVDRSIVTDVFGDDRDVGVALHNGYEEAPTITWVVALINGTNSQVNVISVDDPYAPTMFYPTVLARASYNYGDIDPYTEDDLDKGPFRFAIGTSGLSQLGVDREDQSAMKASVDYIVKFRGFSSTGAYTLASAQDGESLLHQEQLVSGFFIQAGYAFDAMLQPSARYSRVDFEDDLVRHEALGGINVYFYGYDLQWQTDAGTLVTENGNTTETTWQARTQLQLSF